VPYIINLSVPGIPGSILAQFLEERRCLVSTGSACSSKKVEPDPVLCAMGYTASIYSSAIRISLSSSNQLEDIDVLAQAIGDSIEQFDRSMAN
jgi:cysteine desulfurase